MRVLFLKDAVGSPNGVQVVQYKAGDELDIPTALADQLLIRGEVLVVSVEPKPVEARTESPSEEDSVAPLNKVANKRANKMKLFERKGE